MDLTPDGKGRVLADGTVMPLLGLGLWQVPDGPLCAQAVRAALELGYRHIDSQVLLRWCVRRGIPVVGKSTHPERIAENAQIFDFELTGTDMAELDSLDRTGQTAAALERRWW